MSFFDINQIACSVGDYHISCVELIGTVFGLLSVYFASRENILTWGTGIVNEVFLFILFFQVQLYADMFLQVYFFVVTLYGWYAWRNKSVVIKITTLSNKQRVVLGVALAGTSVAAGFLISRLHIYLPQYFKIAASFPYTDSLVMMLSILATVLLARKKIENWVLWILVDCICSVLYYRKNISFLALEYLIFLGLASYGLYSWRKKMKNG